MDKILKFNDFDENTTFPMVLVTFENDFWESFSAFSSGVLLALKKHLTYIEACDNLRENHQRKETFLTLYASVYFISVLQIPY